MDYFDILTNISEHVTLVQLMDSLGNVNRAIFVVGYWILDSNYEKALVLNRESFDIICAPSVGEKQLATFERVSCSVKMHSLNSVPKEGIVKINLFNNWFIP